MASSASEDFFSSIPSPIDLLDVSKKVNDFVQNNVKSGKRIVLITSGGTLVPLEKRTVRFLDNFSTGSRGSLSAEEFLSLGSYAVIFLYRQTSFHPYTRAIAQHADSTALLDHLSCNPNGTLSVEEPLKGPLITAIETYKKIKSQNLLLSITFSDVFQYLHYLKCISCVLGELAGRNAMVYLAAAVSDFYIHPKNMMEHKIQSSPSLVLTLEEVPKMIGTLVQEWASETFIVSFKLETDREKIVPKSKKALEKYKHHVVVGNELEKRKEELVVVTRDNRIELIQLNEEEKLLRIPIERKLVAFLSSEHTKHN